MSVTQMAIRNNGVSAAFDEQSGQWAGLWFAKGGDACIRGGSAPFDLIVDRYAFFGNGPKRVQETHRIANGRGVEFVFEQEGLRITHTACCDADRPVLRQQVRIEVLTGGERILRAVHFRAPGFVVGDPADCRFQAIGQVVPPDASYTEEAMKPLDRRYTEPLPSYPQGWLEPCPDQCTGLVAIENISQQRTASAWLVSDKAPTFPTYDGDGTLIDLEYRHQISAWLRPGTTVVSESFCIMLTEGLIEDHLAQFRAVAGQVFHNADGIPAWVADARLLQICPEPIAPWTARLPELRDMGFNLLYLMPVVDGHGYVIRDHFKIRPGVGTEADVRTFVDRAHALGMRVIFDYIPQGIGDDSPFVEQHPDWLVRDELGRPFGSHGWGPRPGAPLNGHTYSMDWGHPEYRAFAVEWGLWHLKALDADGFRADAMHWKEPNLDLRNPRPAWATSYGGVRLSEELRAAMKAIKPDSILLQELWGPMFQPCGDASYENGWLLTRVNEGWLRGKPHFSGRQWACWLALSDMARPTPEGFLRATFTANHDLQMLAVLAATHPLRDALSFVHALGHGFPFVMWAELPGRESFFRDLMRARAALSGFRCYPAGAQSESDALFTAIWRDDAGCCRLAVANLSNAPVLAEVTARGLGCGTFTFLLASSGAAVHPMQDGCVVRLPPGGYALF